MTKSATKFFLQIMLIKNHHNRQRGAGGREGDEIMRENPIMKYLAETYGITPDQLEEELKNAKIDIGIFVEPWEGGEQQ